jgi:Uma2 family endonuclease
MAAEEAGMTTLILNPRIEERFIAERRANGLDRYDEVWDGVYVVSPDPNFEHQRVVGDLFAILRVVVKEANGEVFPGCNISDRDEDWEKNYRCPDIAAFLPGNPAGMRKAHSIGGPDFAVEIASPGDRTWDKLQFYAQVGTREVLIVDRDPWELTLLRLTTGQLAPVGSSTLEKSVPIPSQVLPLSFRLVERNGHPEIEVRHQHDGRLWQAAAVGVFG